MSNCIETDRSIEIPISSFGTLDEFMNIVDNGTQEFNNNWHTVAGWFLKGATTVWSGNTLEIDNHKAESGYTWRDFLSVLSLLSIHLKKTHKQVFYVRDEYDEFKTEEKITVMILSNGRGVKINNRLERGKQT
jgi:hypothetical protein